MNILLATGIGLMIALVVTQAGHADLTVRFLDVNGGDAVLLSGESGHMLIDSGPEDSGNLTRLYLQSLNITTLDAVMITSPDEMKTGAMTNILNATPAGELLIGRWNSTSPALTAVLNQAETNQTPIVSLRPGDTIPFGDETVVDLLTPANTSGEEPSEVLIPKISSGNISFLIMGDRSGTLEQPRAQIIRVADHGSDTGTDPWILRAIEPEIAIISTGYHTAGLLDPATISNLENSGATVYQTDDQGTISITTDGTRYQVEKLRMEPENTFSIISAIETRPPA